MVCSTPGFPILHYPLDFAQIMSIESVMPSNQFILCHLLLLLPSIFPSFRVLPVNIQDLFPLGLTDLISLQSKRLSKVLSNTTVQSISSSVLSLLYGPTLTSVMTTGKTVTFTIQTFVGKVMSLLFNTLSRFAIVFLPGSMHLLISWLQSPSSGFRAQENKICHCFYFSSSICHEMMGPAAMMLVFWMLNFKPALSLSSFILIRRLILTDNSVPATCEPNQS